MSGSADDRRALIGTALMGYRIVREVGRGGMGVVYEAVHDTIGQRAAVKVLTAALAGDGKAAARLLAEARAASAVAHSGVVKIFNGGQLESGEPYLIMEFLEGESLQKRLDRLAAEKRRLSLEDCIRICTEIAAAVAAVHLRDIIHRDLKPANVMLVAEEGSPAGERVRVVDFGIAKATTDGEAITTAQNGGLFTALYASPEQCGATDKIGPQTDVYSLGILLYELLAGHPPFSGPLLALIGMHTLKEPPPLRDQFPDCPPAVHELVHQMLAKKPEARPTMSQVVTRLRAVSERDSRPSRPWWRHWGSVVGAAGGIALLGSGLLLRQLPRNRPVPAALPDSGSKPAEKTVLTTLEASQARVRALDVIAEGLRAREPLVRQRALAALAQHADPLTRPLVEPLLHDADGRVQAAAARTMARMKSLAARKALLALPGAVLEPRVNMAVTESLLELGAPEALGRLTTLASDADPDIRRHALLRLALKRDPRIRPKVHALLGVLPVAERVPALGEMARYQDRQALDALRRLLPAEASSEVDLRVADELVSSGDESARQFLENTAKKEGPLRLLAARLLAERDDPSYYDMFCEHVTPAHPILERILAVEGIGACRLPSGIPLLGGLLSAEVGPLRFRLAAAEALLLVTHLEPDQMAIDTLLWIERALGDPRWPVRQQATVPLGDAEASLALPLLKRALGDNQPEVRQSATQSLARTRSREAVPLVGGALDDPSVSVRREALHALGELGGHLHAQGGKVDDLVRMVAERRGRGEASEQVAASGALAALSDARGEADLQGWLKNPNPTIRYAAASLLAERGSKAGVAELRLVAAGVGARATLAAGLLSRLGIAVSRSPSLALASADPAERAAAIPQIARMPIKESLPLFRRAARDGAVEVRRSLVRELALLANGGEQSVLPLLRGLALDSDAQTRTHAMTVLVRVAPSSPGRVAAQQAVAAYVQGDIKRVLELNRNPGSALGVYAAAAAACMGRDAESARRLYGQLSDPAARRQVAAQCQKSGIELQRIGRDTLLRDDDQSATDSGPVPGPPAMAPALPTPSTPSGPQPAAAGPTPPAPREKPMRNRDIRLPKKVTDVIPPLNQSPD